jgi:hypothetical protein
MAMGRRIFVAILFTVGLATPTSAEGGAGRRLRNSNLADAGGTI